MQKVLIIREGALGDLILTFPVFFNLKNNNCKVFVCGKGIYKEFVERYGNVDRFFPIDSKDFIFFFQENNEKLKGFLKNFDLIIAYCNKNEIISKNIKRSFEKEIIFHPVKKEINTHITDYLLEPLEKFFKDIKREFKIKIENIPEFFVIHPGSGSKFKNWSKENFLQLCKKLKNVKLLLGPAEEDELNFWEENFKGEIIFNPDLDEIIKIAERTIAYIGNDSGITHLFSITGVETIGIFGPTSPFIWGPRGENVKIIYKNVGCNPCNYEKMKNCKDRKCLNSIKLETILPFIANLVCEKRGNGKASNI